ncbi:putative extracellular nuclease [Xenococcus sp. PCC 7305]|uniref:endonuclease/exonuclease/phosphatase family protein n=1 Tax=Xenococcus sp. PCC 7305 TaxID=102125 RepID=UPI0002AC9D9F|nr:endonuclease/exonuclease/phosphatase family protein [Xenococcus sp. PCC 7305]ELS03441.1 putative extracellular nuclease [Xenococcus sp. PCC 7305]
MKKFVAIFCIILTVFIYIAPLPALAIDVQVGQQVRLKARNDLGVPLHEQSFSSLFDRVADGTVAEVLDTANDKTWLNIKTPDNKIGWIVERYVAQVLEGSPVLNPPPVLPGDGGNVAGDIPTRVWTSANACDAVVKGDELLPRSDSNTLRLASWNIRWFPDGVPGSNPNSNNLKTNLDWLSCTIAWMDIDALAIQEIKTTNNAENAWDKVTQKLNEYTGDDWGVILNSCGSSTSQHVGFLYNKDKLKASGNKEVWQYNGRADNANNACKDNLRPGYLAYFEAENGFDFYAVSVHSDSGRENKDLTTRQTAVERIDDVTSGLADIDKDIVILGDFNTMGIDGGISAKQEIKELKDKVANETPGFNLLSVQPSCTHYFRKNPGLLDHILVSQDTSELITSSASVQGYCAINRCNSISGALPQAAISLSDHCPILVDFNNLDLD